MHNFNENDKIKICSAIERGVRFGAEGVTCCGGSDILSPVIITAEEMASGNVTYDLVVQRRIELFERLNGLREGPTGSCLKCSLLTERRYGDVNFEYLGNHDIRGVCSFNIQHYTMCNLRCSYCLFTIQNNFKPPKYNNIIEFIELFRSRGKLLGGSWIDFNGGEPAILDNFDEILDYLVENNVGSVVIYTNSLKYSQSIYNALKENKIHIFTSIDAGTPSTYKSMKRVDGFAKVISNMIRYRESQTKMMFVLKYIICDTNRTDDDLYGFIFAMLLIKPSHVYICPDFSYIKGDIPYESVEFGARMWVLLEKYGAGSTTVYIQSDDMIASQKMKKFSEDIRIKYKELKEKIDYNVDSNSLLYAINNYENRFEDIIKNVNDLAWWIPIRKLRDKFRNKIFKIRAEQSK